jgi:hypothetical protein
MLTVSFLLGWFFRYLWSTRAVDFTDRDTATPSRSRPDRYARFTETDLKIVEGIGPKIEELLKANGVTTWQILAHTPADRLKSILTLGGERFQMHDPSSWPDQISLALEGRWDELADFQTLIPGGKVR